MNSSKVKTFHFFLMAFFSSKFLSAIIEVVIKESVRKARPFLVGFLLKYSRVSTGREGAIMLKSCKGILRQNYVML